MITIKPLSEFKSDIELVAYYFPNCARLATERTISQVATMIKGHYKTDGGQYMLDILSSERELPKRERDVR